MAHLITHRVNKLRGPILVIGGGPSAIRDLAWIPKEVEFKAVLSANEHGFMQTHFAPTHIVCNDHKHSMTGEFMEEILRPYGVQIITRHWWGDLRIPNAYLRLNSGMAAIVVAVILGGNPVIVVGLDCYTGPTYFHDPDVQTAQSKAPWPKFERQINRIRLQTAGANIRAMSGPIMRAFGAYIPQTEVFREPHNVPCIKYMGRIKQYTARATIDLHWNLADILAGAEWPVSEKEAKHFRENYKRFRVEIEGLDMQN
jgi:hypothetical protein